MDFKPKFTPGYWQAERRSASYFPYITNGLLKVADCVAPQSISLQECLHNAKLISQAPEMYDFIKCRFEALRDKNEKTELTIQEEVELIACIRILEKVNA